ncbi:hypothetical protein [Ruegeria arenilitoris]|uniref:hypothetical protein n=1 Tax=Ruegeria arenilitoris TaxID=1173585 RepID=UPI00148131B2|nr:hypothetical protein [Ruegeria arenilitoris]
MRIVANALKNAFLAGLKSVRSVYLFTWTDHDHGLFNYLGCCRGRFNDLKKGPAIALANAQYRGGHGYVAAKDA